MTEHVAIEADNRRALEAMIAELMKCSDKPAITESFADADGFRIKACKADDPEFWVELKLSSKAAAEWYDYNVPKGGGP